MIEPDHNPSAAPSGPPSSILGSRMAIDHDGPLPTPAELGLDDAKRSAFEWQSQRNYAKLNDIGGTLSGKAGARWVLETHAILGVIAEQVLVAIELEVEKEVARRAIAALPKSSIDHKTAVLAHHSRSLRFFAEGQANAVVVGLHGLANLMARTLEFDTDLTSAELHSGAVCVRRHLRRAGNSSAVPVTYLDAIAEEIRAAIAPDVDVRENTSELFLDYAVLLLAKGEDVTLQDVHNAWVAWMLGKGEQHESMIPFEQLQSETQDEDLPFVNAIREVARLRAHRA